MQWAKTIHPTLRPASLSWRTCVPVVLTAVLLSLSTYIQPGVNLEPGLDSSWAYALNYIYLNDLVMGRDILFTFGPLGYLEHTRGLSEALLIKSSAFWFTVSVLANVALLDLACLRPVPAWHRILNLLLAVGVVFITTNQILRLLVLLYVSLIVHWHSRHWIYLLVFALTTVACLMIKFSYGVMACSLAGLYLLLVAWRDRRPHDLVFGGAVILLTVAGCWWMVYGHLQGMLGYILGGLEFSRGSTSAMALNPENAWHAIALYYAGLLVALTLFGREHRVGALSLSLCFIGPIFIWSKYAFGREDAGHTNFLFLFALCLLPLFAIASARFLTACGQLVSLGLCFVGWVSLHTPQIGPPDYPYAPFYTNPGFYRGHLDPGRFMPMWEAETHRRMEPLRLPEAMREQIGQRTVDIYPWEALIAAANNLNWVPRPVFQNYITYTPTLDRANKQFFDSARAPDFLVWHYHSFPDIDARYPFSSDPLTQLSIFRHYRLDHCASQFCLWRREETPLLAPAVKLPNVRAAWDTWIPTVSTDAHILKARIAVARTLPGKLNLALWKEGNIHIDYRMKDGSIKTHTLLIDNAESGVWVSPYIESLYQQYTVTPVSAEQRAAYLAAAPAEGYIEKLEQRINGVHVLGWGLLPFRDTGQQQLKILFYNEQNTYEVEMEGLHRPGITTHFAKQGEVDLDQCGFAGVVPTQDMAQGEYRVRFVVENGGALAVSQEQDHRATVGQLLPDHDVEAIRLHTTRPWAFSPAIQVEWQGETFKQRRPW
jgi:hypothetical protein